MILDHRRRLPFLYENFTPIRHIRRVVSNLSYGTPHWQRSRLSSFSPLSRPLQQSTSVPCTFLKSYVLASEERIHPSLCGGLPPRVRFDPEFSLRSECPRWHPFPIRVPSSVHLYFRKSLVISRQMSCSLRDSRHSTYHDSNPSVNRPHGSTLCLRLLPLSSCHLVTPASRYHVSLWMDATDPTLFDECPVLHVRSIPPIWLTHLSTTSSCFHVYTTSCMFGSYKVIISRRGPSIRSLRVALVDSLKNWYRPRLRVESPVLSHSDPTLHP